VKTTHTTIEKWQEQLRAQFCDEARAVLDTGGAMNLLAEEAAQRTVLSIYFVQRSRGLSAADAAAETALLASRTRDSIDKLISCWETARTIYQSRRGPMPAGAAAAAVPLGARVRGSPALSEKEGEWIREEVLRLQRNGVPVTARKLLSEFNRKFRHGCVLPRVCAREHG
jgi:hypothetical protein